MATSLNFPHLKSQVSKDAFGKIPRDFTLKDQAEFPYTYARATATRKLKAWKVGYRFLGNGDFNKLWDFWEDCGTSTSFNWVDPVTKKPFEVRFAKMEDADYADFGTEHMWNVNFTLEEI
jgi:hypothetical protein